MNNIKNRIKIESYSVNPNLRLSIINTVNGKKEYRKNCIKIENNYYIIDEDVFFIAEKNMYYRVNSGKIEKDWERNEWILIGSKPLKKGIVRVEEDGTVIYGRFTPNIYNNCVAETESGQHSCLNPDILKEWFFEDLGRNVFVKKGVYDKSIEKGMKTIKNTVDHTRKGYCIEDNTAEFEEKKELYKNYNLKINEDALLYGKYLGDKSYGCELESIRGCMASYLQNRHGIVICRDGSINGGMEAVTVPMKGVKGVQNLIEIGKNLSKTTEIDISCSYHIHIGNIPTDRCYIVALYILSYKLQKDIFKMFPYYKVDWRNYKRKNYCQKLPKLQINSLQDFSKEGFKEYIDFVYYKIFDFLSEGHKADDKINRKIRQHPNREKWNMHSRYFYQNFINMFFSTRNTIESRIHCPTNNPQRLVNWLFMNVAIVRYAEINMKKILSDEKITFEDVLNFYKTHYKNDEKAAFLSDYLIAYYNERVNEFQKDFQNKEYLSDWTYLNDKDYKFSYNGISLFVN